MMNFKSIGLLLIIFVGLMGSVNAHGVDVTPESMIVIADNSSGKLAKNVADGMGLNVSVYQFNSDSEVLHELEHALTNPHKKIIAVAYQETVKEFISKHPEVSNRILISSVDENDIRTGLTKLNATEYNNNGDFLTPLLSGLLIGVILGLAIGAVWMKRKKL